MLSAWAWMTWYQRRLDMDLLSHAQCLGMDDLMSMEAQYGLAQPCSVPGHG
ncbi:hypothetical protein DPMN_073655 [Dreissena polymorpha]|uniref:Uncharacterized protein n=1 Tax=Dreissena polymorpha TaxID=45954 RepID=A0A9D4BZK3_DREPO|nr:hypothetical protein DPMN_073655 [Dreissena polymorpha]